MRVNFQHTLVPLRRSDIATRTADHIRSGDESRIDILGAPCRSSIATLRTDYAQSKPVTPDEMLISLAQIELHASYSPPFIP
jgi:hypothetical protein